jgi:hypothetical protein
MERGHEAETQESSRRSSWQARGLGVQRGQTPRQPQEWPQGRPGQEPQEENGCPPQRQTPTTWTPEERLIVAVTAIRSRFGYGAIGLGCAGIRYSAAALR